MSEPEIEASASAKVHPCRWQFGQLPFPALATAVEPRAYCALRPLDRDRHAFVFNERVENGDMARLKAFRRDIDSLRAEKSYDAISKIACEDFFVPVRYVLSFVHQRTSRIGSSFVAFGDPDRIGPRFGCRGLGLNGPRHLSSVGPQPRASGHRVARVAGRRHRPWRMARASTVA